MLEKDETIEKKLQDMVAERIHVSADKIDLDQSLLEDMGLDSFEIVGLVMEIEEAYPGVSFEDQSAADIGTLREVAEDIRRQQAEGDD